MAVAPTGPPRVSLGGLPGHWGLFHGPRTGCWGQRGGTVPASTGAPRRGWSWGHGLSDPHQGWLVGRGWGVGPVLFRPTMGTTSSRRVPRWHGWTGRWETPHGCGGAGACPGLPTGGWGPALGWPRPGQGPGLRWETLGQPQHQGLGGSTEMALRGQRRGLCEKRWGRARCISKASARTAVWFGRETWWPLRRTHQGTSVGTASPWFPLLPCAYGDCCPCPTVQVSSFCCAS